jgi:hypothetical protein
LTDDTVHIYKQGIHYTNNDDRKDDIGAYSFTNPVDTND